MRIKKAVFAWKNCDNSPFDFGNMKGFDLIFEEQRVNPVLVIDAGNVKIQDESLGIDNKEVLRKLGEIDFDEMHDPNCPGTYSGDIWELSINDKIYKGMLEDPHYVIKMKKIIRFNAVQVYANKKLAGYMKA